MISVGRSEGADVGQKWRREADRVAEVPGRRMRLGATNGTPDALTGP